jgi:exosortase/archaeosortase
MKLSILERIFIYTMIIIGVAIYQLLRLIPEPGFMLKDLEKLPSGNEKRKESGELCYDC